MANKAPLTDAEVEGLELQRTLSHTMSEYEKMNSADMAALGEMEFGVTPDDIAQLVDFDKRVDREQLNNFKRAGGVRSLAHNLRSNLKTGRDEEPEEMVNARKEIFGINKVPMPPPKPLWKLIVEQFEDRVLQILLAGAAVNIIVGSIIHPEDGWVEGVAILVAVCLVVGITAGNDYVKQQQFEKVQSMQKDRTVKCIRAGVLQTVSTYDLVVGDLVEISDGDQVPTDGVFVEAVGGVLVIDESSLTGEPDPIKKSENVPFLFSGTEVTTGKAHYLVTSVGLRTAGGVITSLIAGTKEVDEVREESDLPDIIGSWSKEDVQTWLAKNDCADVGKALRRSDGPKLMALTREDFKDIFAHDPEAGIILRKDLEERKKVSAAAEKAAKEPKDQDKAKTNLELKLEVTAVQIGYGGFLAGGLTFLALSIRWIISESEDFEPERLVDLVHFFVIGVTIVVVAVPEGLPLAVTIALAYGMGQMYREGNFVKVLSSSETMGAATAICSDKTGTLTQNQMTIVETSTCAEGVNLARPEERVRLNRAATNTVAQGFCVNTTAFLEPDPENPGKEKQNGSKTEIPLIMLAREMKFDYKKLREEAQIEQQFSFSSLRKRMSTLVKEKDGSMTLHVKGASEIVLDLCTRRMHADGSTRSFSDEEKQNTAELIESLAKKGLRTLVLAYKPVTKIPTGKPTPAPAQLAKDSKKRDATPETPARIRKKRLAMEAYASAAEVALPAGDDDSDNSSDVDLLTSDNLTDDVQNNVQRHGSDDFEDAVPVTSANIDVALKAPEEKEEELSPHEMAVALEQDLIFVTVLGIEDPLREGVKEAVHQCKMAGIVVRMVTGDNPLTAEKIARECGIMERGHTVMTGPEFRKLPKMKQRAALTKMRVLARSSPEDKLILVGLLRDMGEIVAVTGDGTNDGPALKKANVGFAMGIMGTDIAKNAADITLLYDNFSSIVSAIKWGRSIYDSIRKFLQFQLAVNVVAIIVTLTGSVALGDAPLSAVQLLWVNLIMDTLGALALATEPPSDEVLERPPNHPDESVISRGMMIYIATQVIYQLVALHVVMFAPEKFFDVRPYDYSLSFEQNSDTSLSDNRRILTLLFTTFIILQVFNEMLARHLDHSLNPFKRILATPKFLIILLAIVAVQIIVVTFGDNFTSTVSLTPAEWGICCAFSVIMFPFDFVVRLAVHHKHVWAWVNAPYDPVTGTHAVVKRV